MLLCSCIQFMRNTNPSFPRNKSKLSSSSYVEIKGQLSSPHVLANICWKVKTSALSTLTAVEGEEKLATVRALVCEVKDGKNSPYFILQTAGMRSFCLGCGLACLRPWLCPSGKSALSSGYRSWRRRFLWTSFSSTWNQHLAESPPRTLLGVCSHVSVGFKSILEGCCNRLLTYSSLLCFRYKFPRFCNIISLP